MMYFPEQKLAVAVTSQHERAAKRGQPLGRELIELAELINSSK
jgi:hypothetical protein